VEDDRAALERLTVVETHSGASEGVQICQTTKGGREISVAERTDSVRHGLAWAVGIPVVGLLVIGSSAAYDVRSNLPVELTRSDVVGTWVNADGGPGVAVFHEDGTVDLQDVPGGYPPTGRGEWDLGYAQGPTVDLTIDSTGFAFGSKWDRFRTVLVIYSGDPDHPRSEHLFFRETARDGP
jgi:hypothetical protein